MGVVVFNHASSCLITAALCWLLAQWARCSGLIASSRAKGCVATGLSFDALCANSFLMSHKSRPHPAEHFVPQPKQKRKQKAEYIIIILTLLVSWFYRWALTGIKSERYCKWDYWDNIYNVFMFHFCYTDIYLKLVSRRFKIQTK